MKTLRKNGGFTLVELIVVIAILAILAGVAVPAYSGYIKKAEDAAAITELDAIKTAAQATYATTGAVTKIEFTATNGAFSQITVTVGQTDNIISHGKDGWNNADFNTYMDGKNPTLKGSYAKGAKWEKGTWTAK